MVSSFDRITLAVDDLAQAMKHYGLLLDAVPERCEGSRPSAWLGLANTVIELVEIVAGEPGIAGLVLAGESGAATAKALPNSRGLDLSICDGSITAQFREQAVRSQSRALRVDHLVLRTGCADGCIALFQRQLGIRLALDQNVPEWGGRMLFFRAGKMTLEVIERPGREQGGDAFWGIAYRCDNLDSQLLRLREAGVEVSEVRKGRKPGTRVATLKSHRLGIPTLLIEAT